MGSVFGAEYVWTGGGVEGKWDDPANWGGSGYPGESDNATFSSGAEVTITSDITVNQIYLNAGSKVTCDSNVTISLNSIITQGEFLNKGTLQKRENVSFIIKVEAGGKLINENKIICTDIEGLGNSNITNNGTIEASGAATFQSGANFTNADTLYIGGAMTNVGTFSNSGGTVTVKGTTTNTGTITNTGDFTSEGAITNNSGSLENTGGTIIGNINNTSGNVTNNEGTIFGTVTGNEVVGGSVIDQNFYFSIKSSNTLNWNDDSSWKNGVKPDTEISGDTAVIITLNADVKSTADLTFNNSGSEQIDLYLNGHTLDLSECRFILGNGIGNVNIYGPGNVKVKTFDPSDNGSNSNSPHILNLWDKTEFYIFESLYSSGSTVKITDKTDDCKFYLTASGENVNYGASGIEYIDINPEPYGEPKIYEIIDKGGDPFGTGREIQLDTSRVSNQTYSPIQFQYSVNISGGSWTLTVGDEERELSSTDSSPLPFIELGENETSKNLILKCSTNNIADIENGTGIVITIKTPDGTMDLAKIRWIKGEVQWTGAKDTDFSNPENWSQNETPLTDISALKNNTVVIPSGRTNYPVLESEISVKEIRIQDNASLKIEEGGLLLTEKLIISETGKVDGKNGAIKLCKVTTDSNQVEEVKLENSGWFEVGKLSFEPSAKGIIFGTENQAKTKISELVCKNQGGKSLEIKNTISVETLNLSGASLDSLLSVKNSSEATGTVYLSNDSIGKYLKLATDSLVTVKTSKVSISKSDTSEISDETDFSEKGWVKVQTEYTWEGTSSTNWFEEENWKENCVPTSKEGAEVTIPSGCSKYPVLTENVNLTESGYELDSIFIESGASITLGNFSLSVTTITNMGEIKSETSVTINSSNVILAGTINAESNISISGNLYIIGESSISFGEIFLVGTDENPKDIYISALDSNNEAASVNFIPKTEEVAQIQLSGNFALFNGDVSLGTELVVGKDMILLNGETSGENSIYKDSMTGFDLYKYHLDDRPVSCNLEAFPTEIPNNENISISHEEYKSTFMVENGKTILVWNNFYNNGVDLGTNTTGPWSLKILANDVATSSFAECYNATITNCVVAANTSPGSAWLSTENCTDGTGNTNVAFSKAIFANVATISDNIIRVSFVDGNSTLDEKPEIKIENSCNEISSWAETDNFRFNISSELPEGIKFSGIFANPECTETTDGKGDLSTFYLKYDGSIDYRWNTDATGSDPGAEESTDYSRNHKNVVPNLLFKRAIEASYAGLRDEHKNRLVSVGTNTAGAEPLFEATKDEAPPVLIAVTLGQEQHETEATAQHHYDSHNFIEWQFSEPVEFENYPENGISQIDGVDTSAESENIQSTTNFGKITNNENGFFVAGFGSFETGKVSLGSKTGSGEVNAFYRKFALEAGGEAIPQKNRIRLSIAGYVYEENPVGYKNWLGFIDSKNTVIPSGTFTMPEEYSKSIKDLAGNEGISPKDSIITNAIYSSMSQDLQAKTLYGTWDIDPPVVANYMKETSSGIYAQELLAVNNTGGNTAESLEIHFLDNSAYNTLEGKNNLQWRTKIGWKENSVQITQTIPLDTKGGSRMTSDSNKTLGGLRFSTIIDSLDAFVCQNITTKEYIDLIESEAGFSQITTNENIFGESDVNQFDVPYLTLKFEDAKGSLLKHNYELKYNTEKGFITDLAGNLLYDFTVNSPDKNPPQFLLSIGGVNYDKLYILFSKPIDYLNQNKEPDEGKLRRIVKSISVFESTPDGEKDTGLIDYKLGSKAKVVTKTKESTGIEISLTRKVSYDELKHLYIGVNTFDSTNTDEDADSSLGDPITGEPGEYSMLYDMFENPISEDSKHCFSDFAVNAFDVLYAYDGRAVEEAALAQGVFGGNQWTVTDFSGETNNSSKIIAGKDITIAGKIVDSSENPNEQDKFSMLADISPAKDKAGLDFEDYTDRKTRLWFPDFVKLFSVNNSSTSENFTTDNLVDNGKIETDIDGKDNNIFTYVIPNNKDDSQSVNWADGDEFEFLFKIYNSDNEVIMVDGNVDGDTNDEVDHPLFALRLKDENDITSIDLWSLHIVELVRQKGGTTILNNVINSLNNEETVVEVQVPQTGFLTVQVLTLDGNVVKVLQRGRVEEGTYYYKWNGTNISGAAVARGMYFVRVVGPNIDETRKVMVIKE